MEWRGWLKRSFLKNTDHKLPLPLAIHLGPKQRFVFKTFSELVWTGPKTTVPRDLPLYTAYFHPGMAVFPAPSPLAHVQEHFSRFAAFNYRSRCG